MEDERGADSAAVEVYDVFLSFRGTDTRQEFSDILYNLMIDSGIKVYRDDDALSPGQEIKVILEAIENSRICMPVFSKRFASSSWCLREVAQMVDLKREIIPIFYHVTPDDVKLKTKLYKDQLAKLEKKHGEDQILLWRAALRKATDSKGRELKLQGVSGFVNKLVKELVIMLKVKRKNVPAYLVGIDIQLEAAIQLLNVGSGNVQMLGIYGVAGVGKTALAKTIFNKLIDRFDRCCFLDDIKGDLSRTNSIEDLQERLLVNLDPKLKHLAHSVDAINRIQGNFQNQRVLVVLDNVDQKQQIENLVGDGGWFGLGSRIIITTSDISVLGIADEAPVTSFKSQSRKVSRLKMEGLNKELSLQLLCRRAFGKDSPMPEYKDLATQVVGTTGGLPLALEIIGSLLKGRDIRYWKAKIAELKQVVEPDVKKKVRVSFDALEIREQQIFLDIACFFIKSEISRPTYMWEACGLHPFLGLDVLISRSLVKIEDDTFWMHDQLRILGREIAHDRSFKDPKDYRLYEQREAMNMLAYNVKEKPNIVGLHLDKPYGTVTGHCFADLWRLRFLSVKQAGLTVDFQHPLPGLKWISLNSCPANLDVAGLNSSGLVILELSHSSVDGQWQGWNQMQKGYLKVLDLSYCHCLEVTPDFSKMDLEFLILENCLFLTEFTEDLAALKNLKRLSLKNCLGLCKLPKSFGKLKSLVRLDLSGTRIRTLPDSIGGLEELEQLLLGGSSLVELPETIGTLQSLVSLDLSVSPIQKLPSSIGSLKRLQSLILFKCFKIKGLPESLGDLESLVLLDISSSSVMSLPASICRLKKLERLEMEESRVARLPPQIGELSSLKILNLSRASNIRTLPSTISQLSLLETLVLLNSNRLQELPELPQSLTKLHVRSRALVKVPNLSRLSNLRDLKLIDGSEYFVRTRILESSNLKGIGGLTRLENLQLCVSDVTALPQDMGALSQLCSIELSFPSFSFIPWLPNSLRHLQLESYKSEMKSLNLSYLRYLESLFITGFIFTSLSELKLPESLRSLRLSDCQTRSSDYLPPLKNLVQLELLRCKELSEIPTLEGLDSLETLNIEFCESLESICNLFELRKSLKVTVCCCPKLNVGQFNFTSSHYSKFLGGQVVHDEKQIWVLIKRRDVQVSDYLAWSKETQNEEISLQQGMLNNSASEIVAHEVVVHDLSSILCSRDRDFLIRNNGQVVQVDSIVKCNRRCRVKLLFSASWCLSSQLFILGMKEKYIDEYVDVFIFVSVDVDDESFTSHFSTMPWLAIPFSDSDTRSSLVRLFNVRYVPYVVEFDESGKVVRKGLREVIPLPLPTIQYPFCIEQLKFRMDQKEAARRNQSLQSVLVSGPLDYVCTSEGSRIPATILEGKIVGIYFSYAFFTARSIEFNRRLVETYEELKTRGESFEIVSVSPGSTSNVVMGNLENFFTLPVDLRRYLELVSHFQLKNPTALVIFGRDGRTLNVDAVDAVNVHGAAAYPFTMEKLAEIGWEIVGQNEAAWRKQTLQSAFLHCPLDLLISPNGTRLPVSELEGKVVGLYFAHPSLSCIEFTLDLLDVYEKLKAVSEAFEIVSVYMDENAYYAGQQSFWQSFGTLPWVSLRSSILRWQEMGSYFKVSTLPALVIIGKDGKVIHFNAVDLIRDHGARAYPFTPEKLLQVANLKQVSEEMRNVKSLWPKKLLHPMDDHQLVPSRRITFVCDLCKQSGVEWSYRCEVCGFDLHCECALKNVREQASVMSSSHFIQSLERCCLPFISFWQGDS